MLKLKFENTMTNLLASKWISAEYIADFCKNNQINDVFFRKMNESS